MRIALHLACAGALLPAALAAALPAAAQQMYKWVDERGVVSYSNSPPPSAGKTGRVDVVEERVSVYTPDPLISRAIEENAADARDAKSEQRKREREAARRAKDAASNRPTASASQRQEQLKAAYDRCVNERRVECDTILAGNPSPASYGYNGLPQYVIGTRLVGVPQTPFYVDPTPPPRVGVSTAPPVGISTAPKVGIDDRPPVGAPQRQRPVGSSR